MRSSHSNKIDCRKPCYECRRPHATEPSLTLVRFLLNPDLPLCGCALWLFPYSSVMMHKYYNLAILPSSIQCALAFFSAVTPCVALAWSLKREKQTKTPGHFSRTTWVSRYQKGYTNTILYFNEAKRWRGGSDSGIRLPAEKSFAPHSRQTTMAAPHHWVFYRPDALCSSWHPINSVKALNAIPQKRKWE